MGDDSIDTVISHIDMGYIVTLPWPDTMSKQRGGEWHGPGRRQRSGWCVLHPSDRLRQMWDVLQVFILGYLAFTVPYRQA
jgi:hypothetical protein